MSYFLEVALQTMDIYQQGRPANNYLGSYQPSNGQLASRKRMLDRAHDGFDGCSDTIIGSRHSLGQQGHLDDTDDNKVGDCF